MSNFFKRLLGTEDEEEKSSKQTLMAELSFRESQFDEKLANLVLVENKDSQLDKAYRYFLSQMTAIDANTLWPIADELQLLKSYLALYQSVFKECLHLQLTLKVETDRKIPALLLFPLITNAIHRGYNSVKESPLKVKIVAFDKNITMELSNRVNHHIHAQEDSLSVQRFRQRLQLHFGEDDYTLFFNSNSWTFKTFLQLKLNH